MASELLRALWRPAEFYAMLRVKKEQKTIVASVQCNDPDLGFCYEILQHVSRSFAAVIMQLRGEVRDAVCCFYLVLRALDTVEDDMSLDPKLKVPMLRAFHTHLEEPEWSLNGVGAGEERTLLEYFPRVTAVYSKLPPSFRRVIKQITRRMGNGMADFVERNTVENTADYDLYCHYVAGLVGIGLSQLWESSSLEATSAFRSEPHSNHMGLFLQKTNITRDYLEDISEEPPRIFWPKEIWSRYTDDLHNFKRGDYTQTGLACLNNMILDTLRHLPHCLEYLTSLSDPTVLKFCAIPQVMAIATLCELYNNPKVFKGVVKIRKGEACKIITGCNTISSIMHLYRFYVEKLASLLEPSDGSYAASKEALDHVLHLLSTQFDHTETTLTRSPMCSCGIFPPNKRRRSIAPDKATSGMT
eukprot:NODE_201_length_1831_cov_456.847924_g151_i0.p1 GENE.NODE_201_length_1831_cov_456.847924_g151_i0~~NODE_201_length_1831_cov_456.847924_g151_i0.p1  ORF type:complete len:415 (+),score=62.40 NODE_201_length_1831_cov_456.847924_g151_i0:203-1447(+)